MQNGFEKIESMATGNNLQLPQGFDEFIVECEKNSQVQDNIWSYGLKDKADM